MAKDTSSRKWQITINNPVDKGFTHEYIKELVDSGQAVVYWCMADEIGLEEQTPHTHIFIAYSSACRFTTIKNKFEGAHFEMAKGTCQQNKAYIAKEGKWRNDTKHGTSVEGTFEEFGEMPMERQGARNDLADLFDAIHSGADDFTILENSPQYLLNLDAITKTRQVILEKTFRSTFRKLDVTYICGAPGVGKTRSVMEKYGYENCYRVTDYSHPFDGYRGQDVLIFEEFRNSLKIQDMLVYLDGYPVELPARFQNKVACFTKVYILSNIPFYDQYPHLRIEQKDTYLAWSRRIHNVFVFKKDFTWREYSMAQYFDSFISHDFGYNPFAEQLPVQTKL